MNATGPKKFAGQPKSSYIEPPKAVESWLHGLQEANCLAISNFEDDFDTCAGQVFYPELTLRDLEKNTKDAAAATDGILDGLAALLKKNKALLFSLSLVPSVASNVSIKPFCPREPAYLFDLSDTNTPPARAVRVFLKDGNTGFPRDDKILNLDIKTGVPYLDGFCAQFHGNESRLKEAVAEDIGLSRKQLKALDNHYKNHTADGTVADWNEVVAAVAMQHVAAIAAPVYDDPLLNDDGILNLCSELKGALAGLAHIEHGLSLPVVLYHVNTPPQGQCTYLAQGEKQCTDVAMAAIRKLQAIPQFNAILDHIDPGLEPTDWRKGIHTQLREGVLSILKIDIAEPLPPLGHKIT